MDTGLGLDVQQIQLLLGQGQDVCAQEAERGLTAGVLNAPGPPAVVGQGQGDGLDAALGDEIIDDVRDPGPAAVVLAVQDDEQGTGCRGGRLVQVDGTLMAGQQEFILDDMACNSAVGHIAVAAGQWGGNGVGHVEIVVVVAEAIRGGIWVEGVGQPLALSPESVLDVRIAG